ncbi:MAG: hypothetical protein SV422_12595 [Pseudomonadota bacterium]|nr:hypothetical protein [Pseudomonadota bacterium]
MNLMKITKFAALGLAVASLGATTALVRAQQTGVSEAALREIGIMRNIFAAAVSNDRKRDGFRLGPPEALYLAGQGMLFTFHLNGSGVYVGPGFDLSQISNALQAIQDSPPFNGNFDYDFNFDFDFDDGNFNRALTEQQREYRERLSDMNELIRDRQEELRDAQREIRDLQREARRDPDADNDAQIEQLNTRVAALTEEFQRDMNTMQQLEREYETERRTAFEAVRNEQTALIFTTLCDYGTTLRSLASSEHVSIVLRNYADGQTLVNVFDADAVANCSSADALRQSATTYIQAL